MESLVPDLVVHTCKNPIAGEAEAGGMRSQGQPQLHNESEPWLHEILSHCLSNNFVST